MVQQILLSSIGHRPQALRNRGGKSSSSHKLPRTQGQWHQLVMMPSDSAYLPLSEEALCLSSASYAIFHPLQSNYNPFCRILLSGAESRCDVAPDF